VAHEFDKSGYECAAMEVPDGCAPVVRSWPRCIR